MNDTLHDFIYRIIMDICYDREYAYKQYISVFNEICRGIYSFGSTNSSMALHVRGIKSGKCADFTWSLLKRVDYVGHNEVHLTCCISSPDGGAEKLIGVFELSQGEKIN